MVRDEEIKKLENYARGLGLRVEYRTAKRGDPGASLISVNGISERIVMYLWPRKSKTQIVLDFVHELAHHMGFVYNGRVDNPALLDALIEEDDRKDGDKPITKAKRKLIYECEANDSKYREMIIREIGLHLPEAKFKIDLELDLWVYKHYYLTGNLPTTKEFTKKKSEVKEKYASKV